mgnify:CR=1 FL=1
MEVEERLHSQLLTKIAIASPIARPTPSTIADIIPDLALGTTTFKKLFAFLLAP